MLIADAITPILSQVAGCPEVDVVNAYRYTVIDFCARTYVMTAWVTTTVSNMKAPALTADEQTVAILDAMIGSTPVSVRAINTRDLLTATADNPVITYQNPNVPVITPWPADDTEVQLLQVFTPGPNAVEFPDDVWLRYSETLNQGALSRLLARSKKPYYDPQEAARLRQLYDLETNGAAIAMSRNRSTPAIRLRTQKAPI